LTVTGTGFVAGAVVQVNGVPRTTTVVSATQVTAAILAADVASTGTPTITVFNPTPGGGLSNGAPLTVTTPPGVPTLTSISPTSVSASGVAFTLTATGSGFAGNSVVQVNGTARPTTFGSATQLTAQLTAADRAAVGTAAITVFTPAPGGGTSSVVTLTVTGPAITVGSASVAPGGTMSFTASNGPGSPTDWVALYCPAAQPDLSYVDYAYLNGTRTPPTVGVTGATVTFVAPTTVGATCQVRWFVNNESRHRVLYQREFCRLQA
jgi:hypothetical protein